MPPPPSSSLSPFARVADLFPAVTRSPEETAALGETLAARLQPGDVVALYGDLGAGKTQLAKGVAAGLGLAPDAVTSPTFTLLHEYEGGRLPLYHFDAYRIEHAHELYDLGYEDYFYGDGCCLVEWPTHVDPLLPDEAIRLHLHHVHSDVRRITCD